MKNETKKLKSKCVVCNEPLVLYSYWVYRGDPMRAIIGPGHRSQLSNEQSIRCESCGLQYYKEPSKE